MQSRTLLVTGGSGALGAYLLRVFDKSQVTAPTKKEMPIQDSDAVMRWIQTNRPQVVIHMAALTDVDYCESFPNKAYEINVSGTQNIVAMCRKYGIHLFYISTAAVFDGTDLSFAEEDRPNPANKYAETKYLAEELIRNSAISHTIIRIGWLMGGGLEEKKYISYVFDKIQSNQPVKAVSDIYGSVVYALDLMRYIKILLSAGQSGLYHFGCKGAPSRYDIACALRDMVGSSSTITPVSSVVFASTFPAPRPKREVLTSSRQSFILDWRERLSYYVQSELT